MTASATFYGAWSRMDRMMMQVPQRIKAKLEAERKRGTSAAGLIRYTSTASRPC